VLTDLDHAAFLVGSHNEVAIPGVLFAEILRLIAELRPQPPPTPA
jgi:hypothetical protein